MEFRILGPLEVAAEGRLLDLGGQKQRAVLAMLLLEPNRVVATGRLIDAVWEEEPPETAGKAVQVYVSELRKLVGRERLETRAPGYRLRVDQGELDVDRVRQLVAAGEFDEALSHWRGEPLSDLKPLRFAETAAAGLEELRLACVEQKIDGALAAGGHFSVAAELETLVAAHPLRERLRVQLMLALYRSGRHAEALEAYQTARSALVDGLGLEPSRSLRELQQAILNQDPALDLPTPTEAEPDPARGTFVGRERELEELLAGLAEALAGHGRLFLLVGEPGIGKTRLADELLARARGQGADALVGRCWEAGGAPAYWPWVQSLRGLLRSTAVEALRSELGAGASVLAQLLPELEELFPGLPEPPPLEAETARFRLFEAVSTFLRNAANSRPLVLVLDDLHAADEPSLLLLQFLARELGNSRLLVVGAYRDIDPGPTEALREALTELAREPITRTLVLKGLDEPQIAEMIVVTGGAPASEQLVGAINNETEGNPLFVGEIVRLLRAEGGLDGDVSRLVIPQRVRDVIARRLRHLSDDCNRVLVNASVLGREFSLAALANVSGISEDELLETLDEAMIARVVSDVPASRGQLHFAHVLIRDTLYDELTTARRVRLHRQTVEALEQLYGNDPGPQLAELAHHALAGSEFDKALGHAKAAADYALTVLAYEEAARLYQIAIDALPLSTHSSERERCELLLALGEAEIRAGNSPLARQTFLDAAAIARNLGHNELLARSAAGYGGRIIFERAGSDRQLVPLLEEALAALGDTDADLRVRLLARLAGALRDEPSRDRRNELSQQAVTLARSTGNPAALAYAIDGRLAAIVAPDVTSERLALANELCQLAKIAGEHERVVAGHYHLFIAHLELADLSTARADLEAATSIAEQLRQPAQLWQVTASHAMLALASGRFDEGDHLANTALTYGERSIAVFAVPAFAVHTYTLRTSRGNTKDLAPLIETTIADNPGRPFLRCLLTHLHASMGKIESARELFNQLAKNDFEALPFDIEWLYGASLLAETCATLGDTKAAEQLYSLLSPYDSFNAADVPEGMRGSVSRYLALLATTLQRLNDAEYHYETALTVNERLGALPWLAHTQRDFAQMLLARGKNADLARAKQLLNTATTTYNQLGMPALH